MLRGVVVFPVMLDVRDRRALVVGADADAVGRVARLVEAGARVLVLTLAEPPPEMCTLEETGCVHIERRAARPADLDGVFVTYVSTAEEAQAPPLHARAAAEGRLLCTVDRPELSTFVNPAIVRAGHLSIAISTGGASPALARRIREDLGEMFADPRFASWLDALAQERAALPRGERARTGAEAVRGFSIEGRVKLPGDRTG
ncbi:MAG: NAD(P)-dependent oxidoreductase [Polyangiaceae bacterium]